MFRKSGTTVELPEFVRESIPDAPVEQKEFGSSITSKVYAYTGLKGWPRELYWKPSTHSKVGIVFLVSDDKEIVIGKAQTPFSPFHDSSEMCEIRSRSEENRREEILAPYLGDYAKLLSAIFEKEKIDQEIMIYEFIVEVVGSLDKVDFSVLRLSKDTVRKSILDTLQGMFQRKCNKILN